MSPQLKTRQGSELLIQSEIDSVITDWYRALTETINLNVRTFFEETFVQRTVEKEREKTLDLLVPSLQQNKYSKELRKWHHFLLSFVLIAVFTALDPTVCYNDDDDDDDVSLRPGSLMRPLRKTCPSLPVLKNRTRRKSSGIPKRTEVSKSGHSWFFVLIRSLEKHVHFLHIFHSDETLTEYGLLRPEENQDEVKEVLDPPAHLPGCSGQGLHQRWPPAPLACCATFIPAPFMGSCVDLHRSGVWQQFDQSVPAGEQLCAQLCQNVHRPRREHRYDVALNPRGSSPDPGPHASFTSWNRG